MMASQMPTPVPAQLPFLEWLDTDGLDATRLPELPSGFQGSVMLQRKSGNLYSGDWNNYGLECPGTQYRFSRFEWAEREDMAQFAEMFPKIMFIPHPSQL